MNVFRSTYLFLLCLPGLVFAEEEQTRAIEEVVVTAKKRAQPLNDVGISVNAFTGDTIRELGVTTITDMAEHTPGLIYNEAGALGVPVYTIRGVGFDDYSVASNSTVGVYLDEVAFPYPVMTRGMMFDVERVEVLKGPQGDLYGRNTTGGAINFISAKPTDQFEASITGEYGNHNHGRLEGVISGPLGDSVRARLAGTVTRSRDGWVESHTREDSLGEINAGAVRLLLDWDISDSFTALFNLHYNYDKSENAGQARSGRLGTTLDTDLATGATVPLSEESGWLHLPLAVDGLGNPGILIADAAIPPAPTKADRGDWTDGFVPENDNEMVGGSMRLTWDLPTMSLVSITAYDRFERNDSFDWDGTSVAFYDQISDSSIKSFSQELRLTSENAGPVNWIAGLYYSDDEVDDNYIADVSAASGSLGIFGTFGNRMQQDTTTYAAFGHVEWQLAEQWRLNLGGRFTREERGANSCSYDTDGGLALLFNLDLIDFDFGGTGDDLFLSSTPLAQGDCVTVNLEQASIGTNPDGGTVIALGESELFVDEFDVDNFSGKIGLDFLPNDNWLVYASVGTGFKSGGYNGAAASTNFQLQPYSEEELLAYELGFKATLLDGTMQFNGAAFYYDYDDKQVISIINDPVFGPLTVLVNVPKSEITGAELELTWLPTDGLTINAGLAALDTKVKEYQGFHPVRPDLGGDVDFAGAELGSSPRLTANLLVSYEWSLSASLYGRVTFDGSYTDDYFAGLEFVNPTDDRFEVDSYALANLRAAIGSQDLRWEASIWARNLADEYYYRSVSFSNDAISRGIGQGRTYGVTFSYNFF